MRKCKVLLQKTLLMLFLLTTSTYAFAQGQVNKRVTVNLTSASIYDFFDVVKHQTGLNFIMHVIWTKTHRKELQTKLRETS